VSDPGFASLGPSLLARKGGAKPAMRPQVAPLVHDETALSALGDEQLEDLGWNDMGDAAHDITADIVPINADIGSDHGAYGPGPIVRRQQKRLEQRLLGDAAMTGPEAHDPEYDADEDYEAGYEPEYGDAAEEEYEEEEDEDGNEYEDESDASFVATEPAAPLIAVKPAPQPAPRAPQAVRVPAAQSGRRAAFTLRLDADRHLKLRLASTMQGISAQILVTEALDRLLAEFDDLDVIANHLKRH
jgi:hypothetical protein